MCMAVSLARRYIPGMVMLVMFIVGMAMGVLQRLMHMLMLMALSQMQPDPDNHAGRSQPEQQRYLLAQHHNGNRRPQKRRR